MSDKPNLELAEFVGYGNTLYQWLGTFWTRMYRDRAFLQGLGNARSLKAAQTYLDLLQRLALADRHGNPVFNRERWCPLVIKLSEKNTGAAVLLRFDDTATFDDPALLFDGSFVGAGYVSYPVENVVGINTCIVDNIVSPNKILVAGTDFVYRDGTVIFKESDDPFLSAGFAVYDDSVDKEAVLWACDTNKDNNYVYRGIGYALGIKTDSSDFHKRLLNAVWDTLSGGTTTALLSSLLCAIYQLPVCGAAEETVELVRADGLVVTDKGVYETDPDFAYLKQDDVVKCGDVMDTRLRIYRYPFTAAVAGVPLRETISVFQLPLSLLPEGMTKPLVLGWDEVPVYDAGLDANGDQRFRFKLSTVVADDDLFWNRYWTRCEQAKQLDPAAETDCFGEYISDIVFEGETGVIGRISPLTWYLGQLAGPGTIIVWVKPGGPGYVTPIPFRELLPASVRLLVIEAGRTADDTAEYDVEETATTATCISAAESLDAVISQDRIVATRWI